jgi:hypothetical protein
MIKPGELIDIVEATPLKLSDHRIYNLLIRHAWDRIEEPVEHAIAKKKLRGSHDVNARVDESVLRLMGGACGDPGPGRWRGLGPPLDRLRALLGVPPGKLTAFKNLNRWAGFRPLALPGFARFKKSCVGSHTWPPTSISTRISWSGPSR